MNTEQFGGFPLVVFLKDRTKIQVHHSPPEKPALEKLQDLKRLVEKLEVPILEQYTETIDTHTNPSQQADPLVEVLHNLAEQLGVEAIGVLLPDRKETIFISMNPDTTSRDQQDMRRALGNVFHL